MDRVKTLLMYGVWVVLFFIFSNFLINIGLNTVYRKIENKSELPQINITQAEATHIDGRIYGTINLKEYSQLLGKYLKVNLYSKRNVLLGTNYIKIENTDKNENQNFNLYFRYKDVQNYDLVIIDEIQMQEEMNKIADKSLFEGFTINEMTLGQKVWAAIIMVAIFV